VGSRIAQEVKS